MDKREQRSCKICLKGGIMADTNKWIVVGRLTRDAESKVASGGSAYCRFSIASSRSVKNGEKWEDETSFFDFALFGSRAKLAQYLTKGTLVCIEAQVKVDNWEKDGEKQHKIAFVVDNIQLLGGKKSSSSGSESPVDEDVPF